MMFSLPDGFQMQVPRLETTRPAIGFQEPDYLIIQRDWRKPICMPDNTFEEVIFAEWVENDYGNYGIHDTRTTYLSNYVVTRGWVAVYLHRKCLGSGLRIYASDKLLPTERHFSTLNGLFGKNNWIYLGLIHQPLDNLALIEMMAKRKNLI